MHAGQWRQGLLSMSFPRWPKVTGGLGASKKVKPVPAVAPADSNIEMADFQGMPRCYESGLHSTSLHAICCIVRSRAYVKLQQGATLFIALGSLSLIYDDASKGESTILTMIFSIL